MDNDALKTAARQIADGAAALLAALPADGEPESVVEVVERDYQAEEIERMNVSAENQVKVIEAEAAAAVAVIEAQAATVPDVVGDVIDPPGELIPDVIDPPGELAADNPIEAAPEAATAGELADPAEAVAASEAVIDALPTLDPIADTAADDFPPAPAHWYKRKLWGAR